MLQHGFNPFTDHSLKFVTQKVYFENFVRKINFVSKRKPYLFVNGAHMLLQVRLLRVDLLADVAGGGGKFDHAQVGQPNVLG